MGPLLKDFKYDISSVKRATELFIKDIRKSKININYFIIINDFFPLYAYYVIIQLLNNILSIIYKVVYKN
jgi:hypothetical protein